MKRKKRTKTEKYRDGSDWNWLIIVGIFVVVILLGLAERYELFIN